jgi:tRNA(Arg) A34 adenosine deaminase TadA
VEGHPDGLAGQGHVGDAGADAEGAGAGAEVIHRFDAGAAGSIFNVVQNPALNHRLEVESGVLGEECSALLRSFFVARRG